MKPSFGLFMLSLLITPLAAAECRLDAGQQPARLALALPAQLQLPATAGIGQVLFSKQVHGAPLLLSCSQPAPLREGWLHAPGPGAGQPGLLPSSVAGISVRLRPLPGERSALTWPMSERLLPAGEHRFGGGYELALIKTGPISAGDLRLPAVAAEAYAGAQLLQRLSLSPALISVGVQQPTCHLDSSSRHTQVSLGVQSWSRFRGLGSQSAAVDFELRLRCQPGEDGRPVQVIAQFEDASGGGASDHLQLTGESSAAGLGVRLMRSDGGLLQLGGARHSVARVRPGDDVVRIGLRAAYVQIARQVRPGVARARATVLLSYE
ncbi:fimbrial protein [Pseudomonas shirazensis]|uniref:fimbrial protein n=1 Tax=Pseudomonas shirazensis TaxID=2745494 RepID=UPI003D2E5CE0